MILSLSRIDMEAEQRDGLTLPLFHDDRNQSQEQDTTLPLSSGPASMASMLYPVCLFFLLNFLISVSFKLCLQPDSEPKTLITLLLNM